MGPLAIFGITNDGVNLAVKLILLFLVVIWIALVYWTFAAARRRISDPMLVGCATAASLFPFVGTIVYTIVRPPEYLQDACERELEMAAAKARLSSADGDLCPFCAKEIEKAFLRCPSCMRRLKEPCTTCGKPLDPRWSICPYCEAEVGRVPQEPARRERRERPAPEAAPAPERAAARSPRAGVAAKRAPARAQGASASSQHSEAPQRAAAPPERSDAPQRAAAPPQRSGAPPRVAAPPQRSGAPQRTAAPPQRSGVPQRTAAPPQRSGVPQRAGASGRTGVPRQEAEPDGGDTVGDVRPSRAGQGRPARAPDQRPPGEHTRP